MAPPGHEAPFATVWHEVVATELVSTSQQTCPVGQSQACAHPKVTTRTPEQPVAFVWQLHTPWTIPPEMPVGLKQQSFARRSHPASPQVGTVSGEQALASSPPELLEDEPPLDDEPLLPEDEPEDEPDDDPDDEPLEPEDESDDPEDELEDAPDDDPLEKAESTPPSSPLPLPAIVQSVSSAGQPASTTGKPSRPTGQARMQGVTTSTLRSDSCS
jgi:hypothetical protein